MEGKTAEMGQMKQIVQIVTPTNSNVLLMDNVSTSPGNAMEGKTVEMGQMKDIVFACPTNSNVQHKTSVLKGPGNVTEGMTAEMGRMKKIVQVGTSSGTFGTGGRRRCCCNLTSS